MFSCFVFIASVLCAIAYYGDSVAQFHQFTSDVCYTLDDVRQYEDVFQIYKVDELELTTGTLLDAVVGRIASKQCMSF